MDVVVAGRAWPAPQPGDNPEKEFKSHTQRILKSTSGTQSVRIWIELSQEKVHGRAFVTTIINSQLTYKQGRHGELTELVSYHEDSHRKTGTEARTAKTRSVYRILVRNAFEIDHL
jgi:hypothetical protein